MLHGFVPPVDVSTSAKLAVSGNRIGDRCPYGLGGKRHLRVRHDRELAVVSEASADASTYSSRDDDAPGPKPGGLPDKCRRGASRLLGTSRLRCADPGRAITRTPNVAPRGADQSA